MQLSTSFGCAANHLQIGPSWLEACLVQHQHWQRTLPCRWYQSFLSNHLFSHAWSRPFRKNVKHIILCNPSAFASLLVTLAKPLVSRKVRGVNSLLHDCVASQWFTCTPRYHTCC